jgi:hypothetical protein
VAGSIDPAQQTSATRVIRDQLRQAFRDVPFSLYGSLRVDGLALRGTQALPVSGANRRQIATVVAAQGLTSHAVLISGSWPGSPAELTARTRQDRPGAAGQPAAGLQQPVPAALSAAAAAQLHVTAGSVIRLHSPYDHQTVRVRVTGIFRPADPADPYWQLDPLHTVGIQRGSGFTTYGPLFTTATVMQTGPLSGVLATWVAVPRPAGHISAAGLLPLSRRLSGALSHVSDSAVAGHPSTASALPQLLTRLSAGVLVVRSLLLIGLLELLVLTGAALVLMARRLAGERRSETALMRARGGAEGQLTALGAAEGLMLVVPAAVIGPMLGSWLAAGVAHGWPPPLSALAPPSMAWTVSIGVAAVSLLLMLPASLRAAVSPLSVALLRGRQRAVGSASRAGADLALVVLAAAACWQLAHTASNFTVSETGQLSQPDPGGRPGAGRAGLQCTDPAGPAAGLTAGQPDRGPGPPGGPAAGLLVDRPASAAPGRGPADHRDLAGHRDAGAEPVPDRPADRERPGHVQHRQRLPAGPDRRGAGARPGRAPRRTARGHRQHAGSPHLHHLQR